MIEKIRNVSKSVGNVLATYTRSRADDKFLVRKVWETYGLYLTDQQWALLSKRSFPSGDSITRAARKLKENHPNLRPADAVQRANRASQAEMEAGMPTLGL